MFFSSGILYPFLYNVTSYNLAFFQMVQFTCNLINKTFFECFRSFFPFSILYLISVKRPFPSFNFSLYVPKSKHIIYL